MSNWVNHIPFADVADRAASVSAKIAIGGSVAAAASPYLFDGVTPFQWLAFGVSAIVGSFSILWGFLNWRTNQKNYELRAEALAEKCRVCQSSKEIEH